MISQFQKGIHENRKKTNGGRKNLPGQMPRSDWKKKEML